MTTARFATYKLTYRPEKYNLCTMTYITDGHIETTMLYDKKTSILCFNKSESSSLRTSGKINFASDEQKIAFEKALKSNNIAELTAIAKNIERLTDEDNINSMFYPISHFLKGYTSTKAAQQAYNQRFLVTHGLFKEKHNLIDHEVVEANEVVARM